MYFSPTPCLSNAQHSESVRNYPYVSYALSDLEHGRLLRFFRLAERLRAICYDGRHNDPVLPQVRQALPGSDVNL